MSKFTNFLNYQKSQIIIELDLLMHIVYIYIIHLTKNSLENYFILLFLISGIEGYSWYLV